MKKYLLLVLILSLCFVGACSDAKTPKATETEVNAEAEEAVKAYEAWFVKYDSLATKTLAGEDVLDALMELQFDEGMKVTEKLLATESLRNEEQKARVKAVEQKADSIKEKIMAN